MTSSRMPTIVNVGYRSTNYWVVGAGRSRLLVDIGYPGSMGLMLASLARKGVPLEEIKYALATHYHLDHAGLAQNMKLAGVPLLVLQTQLAAVPRMREVMKPADRYLDITMHDNVVVSCAESRALLERIGIAGEILSTPGHSEDSVSLLLDDGSVFTGDLTPPWLATEEQAEVVNASWKMLHEQGARRVYPAHGPIRRLQR